MNDHDIENIVNERVRAREKDREIERLAKTQEENKSKEDIKVLKKERDLLMKTIKDWKNNCIGDFHTDAIFEELGNGGRRYTPEKSFKQRLFDIDWKIIEIEKNNHG